MAGSSRPNRSAEIVCYSFLMTTRAQAILDGFLDDDFVLLRSPTTGKMRVEPVDGPWLLAMIRTRIRDYQVGQVAYMQADCIQWCRRPGGEYDYVVGVFATAHKAEQMARLKDYW